MVGVRDQGAELRGALRAIGGSVTGEGRWSAVHQPVAAARAAHLVGAEGIEEEVDMRAGQLLAVALRLVLHHVAVLRIQG